MWIWNLEIWLYIILISFCLFIIKIWNYRKLPPGPWGTPILGYLPWLDYDYPYLTMTKLSKKYGPIYSLKMGKILAIVISDSKIIRQALNKDSLSGRADLYLAHGIMQGYGIIGSQGPLWKEQRKFAVTCLKNLGATKFGSKRDKLEAVVLSAVEELIVKVNSFDNSDVEGVDILHPLMHSIGNVINQLIFGRTWSEDDPIWQKLQYLADVGLKKMGEAGVLNFLPILRFIPKYKKSLDFVIDGLKVTHEIYQSIIDDHNGTEDDVIAAFINEMKSRGNNIGTFTQKQLWYLLADLFGAGVDTTVASLRWFLLSVAYYPEIQMRIQKEIDETCGNSITKLDFLSRLPYLEAAISESQRFRSVVPMGVPHGATNDCFLESYFIPKGSMIIPLQWAVHMDPKIWPEPYIFKPERFLDSDGNYFKPDSFIPFQIGKRICLGEELGRIILFLFASNILKKFTVKLPEDVLIDHKDNDKNYDINVLEGEFDMLLRPKYNKLILIPREV